MLLYVEMEHWLCYVFGWFGVTRVEEQEVLPFFFTNYPCKLGERERESILVML